MLYVAITRRFWKSAPARSGKFSYCLRTISRLRTLRTDPRTASSTAMTWTTTAILPPQKITPTRQKAPTKPPLFTAPAAKPSKLLLGVETSSRLSAPFVLDSIAAKPPAEMNPSAVVEPVNTDAPKTVTSPGEMRAPTALMTTPSRQPSAPPVTLVPKTALSFRNPFPRGPYVA